MSYEKVIISGEGGQGVQTIAKILQRAAFNKRKETLYVPNFGVEQRGGVSIAFLQISENKIYYPKFQKADLAVLLSARSVERVENYINQDTKVLYNSSLIKNLNLNSKEMFAVDASNIALKYFSPKVLNIVVLKSILKYFDYITRADLVEAMEEELGYKFVNNGELREMNLKVING